MLILFWYGKVAIYVSAAGQAGRTGRSLRLPKEGHPRALTAYDGPVLPSARRFEDPVPVDALLLLLCWRTSGSGRCGQVEHTQRNAGQGGFALASHSIGGRRRVDRIGIVNIYTDRV